MQDPSTYFTQFPEHEILKCPRCDSSNTKFCYYNNYNLSQPRHYCKNCKRYWTKGGTLRNIPVGGASRKITKRSSSSSSSCIPKPPTPITTADASHLINNKNQPQQQQMSVVGSSSSSYLIGSLYPRMGLGGFEQMRQLGGGDQRLDPKVESEEERFGGGLESGEMNYWSGTSNDWPDLAIYTSGGGSSFDQTKPNGVSDSCN